MDGRRAGDWDRFHIRNLGLAVQRRMRTRYGGDPEAARRESAARVAGALGVQPKSWPAGPRKAFGDLALVLDLLPDLARWPRAERGAILEVSRAKAGAEEIRYLHLLQSCPRLRKTILKLGARDHAGGGP
jgi:hypothetical protein